MGKRVDLIVRRSVDYGGDRSASSYLIEGANGLRFSKCSIFDAKVFKDASVAKKTLEKIRRNDPHKTNASYEIVPMD
jgi:hypothetical protein